MIVMSNLQFHWWLKGFGDKVEVVGPTGLHEELIEMAQNLIDGYISKR